MFPCPRLLFMESVLNSSDIVIYGIMCSMRWWCIVVAWRNINFFVNTNFHGEISYFLQGDRNLEIVCACSYSSASESKKRYIQC